MTGKTIDCKGLSLREASSMIKKMVEYEKPLDEFLTKEELDFVMDKMGYPQDAQGLSNISIDNTETLLNKLWYPARIRRLLEAGEIRVTAEAKLQMDLYDKIRDYCLQNKHELRELHQRRAYTESDMLIW